MSQKTPKEIGNALVDSTVYADSDLRALMDSLKYITKSAEQAIGLALQSRKKSLSCASSQNG
jgi:hypothetical protein